MKNWYRASLDLWLILVFLLSTGKSIPIIADENFVSTTRPQTSMTKNNTTTPNNKLRLMQFNIRQGKADWGRSTAWWQNDRTLMGVVNTSTKKYPRRKAVAACIAEHQPDIVATQEGIKWQLDHIEEDLGGTYAWVGRGRGTRWCPDETSAIFYKKDEWLAEHSGDFMHSPTPAVWGSSYKGSSWPMITTWVVLRGREGSSRDGRRALVFSTHLDPLNTRVRTISAEQVLAEAARLRTKYGCRHVFLLGDFNCDCGEPAYRRFEEAGWVDAVSTVKGPSYPPGSFTYHAFKGPAFRSWGPYFDRCIDFIWLGPPSNTNNNAAAATTAMKIASVLTDKRRFGSDGPIITTTDDNDANNDGGVYPSDHYPVIADVVLC